MLKRHDLFSVNSRKKAWYSGGEGASLVCESAPKNAPKNLGAFVGHASILPLLPQLSDIPLIGRGTLRMGASHVNGEQTRLRMVLICANLSLRITHDSRYELDEKVDARPFGSPCIAKAHTF
ncbi:hypothetical protein QF017_003333 [Pseudomonas laurylsulfatiphila]